MISFCENKVYAWIFFKKVWKDTKSLTVFTSWGWVLKEVERYRKWLEIFTFYVINYLHTCMWSIIILYSLIYFAITNNKKWTYAAGKKTKNQTTTTKNHHEIPLYIYQIAKTLKSDNAPAIALLGIYPRDTGVLIT